MLRINIDTRQFTQHIKALEKRLQRYIEKDAPRIMGTEAVNFYKANFRHGGFLDRGLKPWKKPKRTDASSKWYGFSYRSRVQMPSTHPRRSATKKYRARKENPITNYSPAATKRKTLIGDTGNLMESIEYKTGKARVTIESNLPYAEIHNQGGMMSVFGKTGSQMPKRQFIGESHTLNSKIKEELEKDINHILKK